MKEIKIEETFRVPGTDVVIEAGQTITLSEKHPEFSEASRQVEVLAEAYSRDDNLSRGDFLRSAKKFGENFFIIKLGSDKICLCARSKEGNKVQCGEFGDVRNYYMENEQMDYFLMDVKGLPYNFTYKS